LHYTQSDYERERFEEVAQMQLSYSVTNRNTAAADLRGGWLLEQGYTTPNWNVRGAMFRDDTVLLVRERSDGKWTLPGGFADVNEWPSLSVTKEIEQESGFTARVLKLAAVHDP